MHAETLEYFASGHGVLLTFRHRKQCPEQYSSPLDRWGIGYERAKLYETARGGFQVRLRTCRCLVEVSKRRWERWKTVARLEGRWGA